jgi:GNAT superfamily N-acetyltransferase
MPSLIVDSSNHSEWHNWAAITDSGFIRTHDAGGDTLYGMEIMVDPDYRGLKLSRRLYDARKRLARERNLTGIIGGGDHTWHSEASVHGRAVTQR